MSSTIKGKTLDHSLKRQRLQESAQQKNQTTSSHLNALHRIKEAVQKSRAELNALNNSKAVVNHITTRNLGNESEDESTPLNSDQNRLYTRTGKLDNIDQDFEAYEVENPVEVAEEKNINTEHLQSEVVPLESDDSFYKVQDRGNQISEDAFGYYIDAYAPDYEKDGIRISISNDKAIISGSRKAQNEFQDTETKMTTNNFQTFREEFAFAQPVVTDGMTRERDGDYIRFFIPKMGALKPNT